MRSSAALIVLAVALARPAYADEAKPFVTIGLELGAAGMTGDASAYGLGLGRAFVVGGGRRTVSVEWHLSQRYSANDRRGTQELDAYVVRWQPVRFAALTGGIARVRLPVTLDDTVPDPQVVGVGGIAGAALCLPVLGGVVSAEGRMTATLNELPVGAGMTSGDAMLWTLTVGFRLRFTP